MNFKMEPGDFVRCINAQGAFPHLETGKVYKVHARLGSLVVVKVAEGGWDSDRFEPVSLFTPDEMADPSDFPKKHISVPKGSYEDLGAEIGRLVETKQLAYGDSFTKTGQVMRILYPLGIDHSQLDDALTVVRMLDKLFRIATDRDALGESPFRDIAGYALLSVARVENK